MENWPLELPGSGGLREPFLPLSLELWLAAQPCRYPLAEREKAPISVGLLGILVGLTLFFAPCFSEPLWERLLSQCILNLSVDLCNIHCSGLEKNGKLPLVSQ